jgi:phosphatidate cytidylyltransferase
MKTRLITSAVGIIIGVTIVLLSDTVVLPVAVSAIIIIMLHELFSANKCIYSKSITAVCYIFAIFNSFSYFFEILAPYRSAIAAIGIFVIFALYINGHKEIKFEHIFFMIAATSLITYSMCCLIELHSNEIFGKFYIVLSLCAAWIADSGAYFAGTFLGKHKLCPEISPKKTVEGFIGGLLTNGIFMVVISMVYYKIRFPEYNFDYIKLFILGVICAVLGTLGDLSASIIKRQCNIKDYGNIMPGHGGLLDRFDSVLFVIPFMNLFINMFGIIQY